VTADERERVIPFDGEITIRARVIPVKGARTLPVRYQPDGLIARAVLGGP